MGIVLLLTCFLCDSGACGTHILICGLSRYKLRMECVKVLPSLLLRMLRYLSTEMLVLIWPGLSKPISEGRCLPKASPAEQAKLGSFRNMDVYVGRPWRGKVYINNSLL